MNADYRNNPHYHCDFWRCPFCGANKLEWPAYLGPYCPSPRCGHRVLIFYFQGEELDPTSWPVFTPRGPWIVGTPK